MMSAQNIRLALLAGLLIVGMLLFNQWQEEQVAKTAAKQSGQTTENKALGQTTSVGNAQTPRLEEKEIPQFEGAPGAEKTATNEKTAAQNQNAPSVGLNTIQVTTDVLNVKIDPEGGDIVYLSLPKYAEGENEDPKQHPYILFDRSASRYYIAQSGLTGDRGPDLRGVGRARYETNQSGYQLDEGQDRLVVDLKTRTEDGVNITKRYVFIRGSYLIELEYLIDNQSKKEYVASFYGRLKRKPEQSSGIGFLGIQTYTGAALHTKDTPYKKISFKDIEEKPFSEQVTGGWAAMVEHYFVGAFIPEKGITYTYQTTHLKDGADAVGFIAPPIKVAPGSQDNIESRLYAGPQITEVLEKLGPGLELAVDYGVLWPVCQPIFWVLKRINDYIGNWGWSIVIITIFIKLLFYKLSESSYRSMGNMRKLQPKIEALKERYGEDKQKFSQAVMELYKKEKVNPIGGCLPILIQIPVFIALYYVLLGSVELRQAPFILWIHDLSVKDPYYVLPILMGISMLVQQKLNPPPPDPIQAKVMMVMPVVFTVLFLNFPAGLVLYWFVNNVLSIAQQWYITRSIGRTPHGTHTKTKASS